MITTSSYKNILGSENKTLSISADKGKDANYSGQCYTYLAPKRGFWRTWKDNRGIIPDDINNKYYIEHYYDEVLSELEPNEVYNDVNNNTLLCYEDNMDFCHRHIVAAWLELMLDIEINEIAYIDDEIIVVDKPSYIKEYLEQYIKSVTDMKGFGSLRALYIFNKSEEYKEIANYLRCEASDIDEIYNIKKLTKIKNSNK